MTSASYRMIRADEISQTATRLVDPGLRQEMVEEAIVLDEYSRRFARIAFSKTTLNIVGAPAVWC